VAQALAALPPADDRDLTWEERLAPRRALLKRYPNDLFVQLDYQDTILGVRALADELDGALALYHSIPDKTLSQYLEARLLWHSQVRESRETLNRLVETVPQFPWPHLTLVEIAEWPGNSDRGGVEEHLHAFQTACPNALEGYGYPASVKDPEMIRSGAAQLRRLLSVRTDAVVWRYYPVLWELEFRATPKEEHDKARQLVRDDVKRLESLEAVPSESWRLTFEQASELAQDPSIRSWLVATILSKFPNSQYAINIAEDHWRQEHPQPSIEKEDDYKKWNAQHFEAVQGWLKRWPNSPSLIDEQYEYLTSLPVLPTEKFLAIFDQDAEVAESHPDFLVPDPPFSLWAAQGYVERKVRLDRVPKLIEIGLRQAMMQEKYEDDPELLPPENRGRRAGRLASIRYDANITLADLYLYTKQTSKAEDVLTQVGADLEADKPAENASQADQNQYRNKRWGYLQRLAQLEEMEGKPQDALAHYQEVLQQLPRRRVEEEKEASVRAARQLYLRQGGQAGNWLAWATSPEKPSHGESTLTFSAPLPDFAVKDLAGREWRLSDLKGKVTLLDFWATWCGPCRGELPFIQKLYDQIKDRTDLQVVTISVDENPGLLEAYLKETHFTFPILPAEDLAEKIFPVLGLPQTRIVDPEGRRSQDQVVGYSDEWVSRIIAKMERVRGETH
jgi:thiol-disulfide isomerase/thioredoxin